TGSRRPFRWCGTSLSAARTTWGPRLRRTGVRAQRSGNKILPQRGGAMNKHPLRPVTRDDIARVKEDGAICVRNVFDREWCERMNAAVERLLLNPGKRAREATKSGDPGRFHMNVFMWRWDPDFRDFALNSPLAELGATLLEQDKVSLFYDQAFIKEPGTREVTQWHQDLPY